MVHSHRETSCVRIRKRVIRDLGEECREVARGDEAIHRIIETRDVVKARGSAHGLSSYSLGQGPIGSISSVGTGVILDAATDCDERNSLFAGYGETCGEIELETRCWAALQIGRKDEVGSTPSCDQRSQAIGTGHFRQGEREHEQEGEKHLEDE